MKTLTLLNRVEIKYPMHTIVYRVRSDAKTYSVTLHEDGTTGCYDEQNEECKPPRMQSLTVNTAPGNKRTGWTSPCPVKSTSVSLILMARG